MSQSTGLGGTNDFSRHRRGSPPFPTPSLDHRRQQQPQRQQRQRQQKHKYTNGPLNNRDGDGGEHRHQEQHNPEGLHQTTLKTTKALTRKNKSNTDAMGSQQEKRHQNSLGPTVHDTAFSGQMSPPRKDVSATQQLPNKPPTSSSEGIKEETSVMSEWWPYHKPFFGRTDDPSALELDMAVVLYRKSLRDIRHIGMSSSVSGSSGVQGQPATSAGGAVARPLRSAHNQRKLSNACSVLIRAILMDPRCVRLCQQLPVVDRAQESCFLVDVELIQSLEEHGNHGNIWIAHRMLLAMHAASLLRALTGIPERRDEVDTQTVSIQTTLDEVKPFINNRIVELGARKEKNINSSGFPTKEELVATMARWNLWWASLYTMVGDWRLAEKHVAMCQRQDNGLILADYLRALIYTRITHAKATFTLFKEWQRYVNRAHNDDYNLAEAFSWLAFLIVEDSKLGTMEHASCYLELSNMANARRMALYSTTDHSSSTEMLTGTNPFMGSWVTHKALQQKTLDKLRACSPGNSTLSCITQAPTDGEWLDLCFAQLWNEDQQNTPPAPCVTEQGPERAGDILLAGNQICAGNSIHNQRDDKIPSESHINTLKQTQEKAKGYTLDKKSPVPASLPVGPHHVEDKREREHEKDPNNNHRSSQLPALSTGVSPLIRPTATSTWLCPQPALQHNAAPGHGINSNSHHHSSFVASPPYRLISPPNRVFHTTQLFCNYNTPWMSPPNWNRGPQISNVSIAPTALYPKRTKSTEIWHPSRISEPNSKHSPYSPKRSHRKTKTKRRSSARLKAKSSHAGACPASNSTTPELPTK